MKSAPRFFASVVIAFLTTTMIGISILMLVVGVILYQQGYGASMLRDLVVDLPKIAVRILWPYPATFAFVVAVVTTLLKRGQPRHFWRCIGLGVFLTLVVYIPACAITFSDISHQFSSKGEFFGFHAFALGTSLLSGCPTTWIVRKFQMILERRAES
ncbi:MAG: hypothetical protein AAF585_28355 [Verrucomicrobiota bacterium]